MEEVEEEHYYTSRKLYQHVKYNYIVVRPYGANQLQDIQQLPLE